MSALQAPPSSAGGVAAPFRALSGLVSSLPRLWTLRRRQALARGRASLPVSGLTDADALEAAFALRSSAGDDEAKAAAAAARLKLLSSAQSLAQGLCAELHAAGRDAAHWRARAGRRGVGIGNPLGLLRPRLARPPSVRISSAGGAPGGAGDAAQAKLAQLRVAEEELAAALAAVHDAARPLGATTTHDALPAAIAEAAARLRAAALPLAPASVGDEPRGSSNAPAPAAASLRAATSSAVEEALAATDAALSAASVRYPVGRVPHEARRPSAFRTALPRYLFLVALGAAAARWLLARHYAGDLARWAAEGKTAVVGAFDAHLRAPLKAVADELVTAFRARPGAASAVRELQASKESLERQLAAFAAAHGGVASASPEQHMALLMHAYESQASRPLRSLATGDLAWTLLIQIQKAKTDGEAALAALDQVMRSNNLTISLVAALPALAIVGAIGSAGAHFVSRRMSPTPPQPGAATAKLRAYFAAAERLVESGGEEGAGRGRLLAALDGAHAAAAQLILVPGGGPALIPRTAELRSEAWDALQTDLLRLAHGGGAECAQRTVRAHPELLAAPPPMR